MSDHPSNHPDLSSHFHGLNMSAQPFVPSVHAPSFQPGGNYGPVYGSGQYMGGPPPVPGMYPRMPYHLPNYGGMGGYMQQQVPYQHHVQQGRPPLHQMNPHTTSTDQVPNNNRSGLKSSPQHYQTKGVEVTTNDKQEHHQVSNPVSHSVDHNLLPEPVASSGITTVEPTPPVDSWEDIVTEEPSLKPDPALKPEPQTHEITKKAVEPVTTSSSSSSSTPESSHKPEKHHEKKSKDTSSSDSCLPKVAKIASYQPGPVRKQDEKENVNIVFIGHVDAGKSTIGGHLMYLTGQVDKRTLEKYEKEAKEKNRETWYLSWALDTNQEERDKGKTVEVGRASFETDKKRFSILDAPGHAGFVPSMISGTVQADLGILVISARRGEFETGFERRGQTREHAMLAKTAGVKHLVVLVNKMDDPTVCWDEERYEEIKEKLTPFLKKVGFNPKTDIHYIPVSGLTGANLKDPATDACPWFKDSAFLPYLEDLPPIAREDEGPLRMPIADKFKDMGTMVIGKVESGSVGKGSSLVMMPNRTIVEVLTVIRVEEEVAAAFSGDNIKMKLKGVEEEDVSPGFVLCSPHNLCHTGRIFDAQVVILEYKSIICAGFSCIMHIHTVVEEVEIINLIARIDKKTGKKVPAKPKFIKQDYTAVARFQTSGTICMESFKDFPAMARFTLRDEGKTIAIGKVLKIIE